MREAASAMRSTLVPERLGDLRVALAGEILQVIADDLVFDGFLAALAFELQQQRLGNAGCADARRIERLHQLERRIQMLRA